MDQRNQKDEVIYSHQKAPGEPVSLGQKGKAMDKIIKVWDKTEQALIVFLIGIASYLTFQEVILRYVFNTGWSGSYEITTMALIMLELSNRTEIDVNNFCDFFPALG